MIKTDITKSCVFLRIHLHKLGDKRGVAKDDFEVDANKDFVTARKTIFKSAAFNSIKAMDREIRNYVRDNTTPYDSGLHLASVKMVELLHTQLKELRQERQNRVDFFCNVVWPTLPNEVRGPLRKLWQQEDYQSDVKDQFSMDWIFHMISTSDSIESVNPEIFKEERQKISDSFSDALTSARYLYREVCLELLRSLRERLEPDNYGVPKRMSPRALAKMLEFVSEFPTLKDVTDDTQLRGYLKAIGNTLQGVSSEELKETEGVRERVHTELARIEILVDKSLEDAPRRRIRVQE